MKITVMDVMNSKSNVRDYLSVHPENGRIYVNSKAEDVVLIDRTAEWDELKAENERLRKALKLVGSDICTDEDREFIVEKALKGESK